MASCLLPPLALYVHIPWCVKKCPYCDFNSHASNGEIPVSRYIEALKQDLTLDQHLTQGRKISSIFFGGGTPSLFPGKALAELITFIDHLIGISDNAEITIEANPGTAEYDNFSQYRDGGINRLSMGVQSFNDQHLKQLGRIHSGQEVLKAYDLATSAGFTNINLDLIHGLENQTVEQAESDIQTAIALHPSHLSWYQLTIEPNTAFYSSPPVLPVEDVLADIQEAGHDLLEKNGYKQYEVSAYAKAGKQSAHNLNYWQFGDYLAIGAGAHGKITLPETRQIVRYHKTRQPNQYMEKETSSNNHPIASNPYTTTHKVSAPEELPFEFMINAMRICDGVDHRLFEQRTFLNLSTISHTLSELQQEGLIDLSNNKLKPTAKGHLFLNNVLERFMN